MIETGGERESGRSVLAPRHDDDDDDDLVLQHYRKNIIHNMHYNHQKTFQFIPLIW